MKKHLLLSLLMASLSPLLHGQSYWIQKAGGQANDEAMDISADGQGNTYTTGYYSAIGQFGTFTLNNAGITDVFLTKTDGTGQFMWAVKGGGPGSDRGLSVKTDAAGNSVITGYYYNTATFGTQNITASGLQDIFIAKYDNTGTLLWVKTAGGTSSDIGNAVTLDNNGNVIVTGEFSGTAQFGTTTLISQNGSVDVFTTKLDANGNFLWAKKGSAPQIDRGIDLGCDASGNIYVTGQFTDTITFDVTHNNNMFNAIFLIKYNPSGAEQWFRVIGGGSQNVANALVVDGNNNIILAGDFLGPITFFACPGNVTLTNTYPRRIFVASYNTSGNLNWKEADGSNDVVNARNVSVDANNDVFITGNFKCKFNEYADQYGQGIFNTVGFFDVFVSKYSGSTGAWQWARQLGGKKDDSGNGITNTQTGVPVICGSFDGNLGIPVTTAFLGYGYSGSNNVAHGAYCNDPYYGDFGFYNAAGGYDAFLGMAIDPSRSPYDYYKREGQGCVRDYVGVCIEPGNYSLDTTCGPDSIEVCNHVFLNANSNTSYLGPTYYGSIGPDFTYLWSTGANTRTIYVTSSGSYSVILTSADGCFTSFDTMYVLVHADPPLPLLSDNVIVNTNAAVADTIIMCAPGSAWLWGSNFSPGDSIYWTDPYIGQVFDDSLFVNQSALYCFTVVNAFGCATKNCIPVIIDSLLPPIIPEMSCLNDGDQNDSIAFCQGSYFTMLVYDSITNPLGIPTCIPYATITWSVSPNTITYTTTTTCMPNSTNYFLPLQSGWYAITAMVVRKNNCDTDTVYVTKNIYVELYPVPAISLPGFATICPGDSVLLIGNGGTSYQWLLNNVLISTNDSLWVTQSGSYNCIASNSYGCTAYAWCSVTNKPPPLVTMNPSTGLICPNDSVLLTCSGSGNFQWYGPSGPFGTNSPFAYGTGPGNYYCVLTDSTGCVLVSNTVTLIQYATPFLLASPDNIICQDDSVVLNIVTNPGSIVQWQSPLSGSSLTQVVTTPGTFTCSIISCGITTLVSVNIVLSVPVAQITSLDSLVFCTGDSALLSANTGNYSYSWDPNDLNSQIIYAHDSGLYVLTVTDINGCTATDSIRLVTYANTLGIPQVADTFICEGKYAVLNVTGSPTLEWFTDPNSSQPFHYGNSYTSPPLYNSLTYYIQSHAGGCRSPLIPVNITVDECDITVPNVFTPNGDGINDLFSFHSDGMNGLHCKIFNRWGNLIYEWNDILGGWDGTNMHNGKLVSDGVYYYIADIEDLSGNIRREHGFVQVLQN